MALRTPSCRFLIDDRLGNFRQRSIGLLLFLKRCIQ
jgi:hypothetical protein